MPLPSPSSRASGGSSRLPLEGARAATALRFLLRSLTLRGPSFLLALLAVTTGATIMAAMLNLEADVGAKMSRELRRYGPNLLVTPSAVAVGATRAPAAGHGPTSAAGSVDERARGLRGRPARGGDTVRTLDETTVRSLAGLPLADSAHAGASVSPLLISAGAILSAPARDGGRDEAAGRAEAAAPGQTAGPGASAALRGTSGSIDRLRETAIAVTVLGADLEVVQRLYPSWRLEGLWPEPGQRACLVGSSLARRAAIVPGTRALVWARSSDDTPMPLDVVGVVSTGESEDERVLVPLQALQQATGLAGRVSLAALTIEGGPEAVAAAARRIEATLPGATARPVLQIAAAQGEIMGKLRRMMLLLTAVVLGLSALCLTTTLMSIVIEREREIGLMRSIGAGDGAILAMFLGEVSLLGLLGGVLGLVLGSAATRLVGARLFEAAIEPRAGVVPIVLVASVLLCLIAVLIPVRRALAVQPATALRGD